VKVFVPFVRYGIAAAFIVAGQVVLIAADPSVRLETWAGFTGAGVAILLLNVLYRIGAEGDRDRDREEEARRYFDEHGHWPGEAPRRRR
jgi:hypothetical protein